MLDNLARRLTGIFAGLRRQGRLSEDDVATMLREVRVALLEADVNFAVAKRFVASVKEKAVGEDVFGSLSADQTIVRIVRDELTNLLGGEYSKFKWASSPPTVILLCGLQGSGKTTTAAKLAKWLIGQGKKPMMAACDLQRPAAIHQLEVLGEQVGVPVAVPKGGETPLQVAKDALGRCKHMLLDTLIVDTAGRLQIDEPLMRELKAVRDAVKPHETLIVVDSTTGQEAVNVSAAFHEAIALTGAIFTKLDGDARGGAVLSVREATGVPVRFIGVGEQIDALELFHPDRMAQRILGMGDVLGIIEKAEQAVDQGDAADLEAKLTRGTFNFEDMLQQFAAMRKMGPLQNVLKMVPGFINIPQEAPDQIDDKKINRIESIILSMTPRERTNPDIINGSRRKRLARGSGTSVEEVNGLIKQLYEMRRNMKQIGLMKQRYGRHARRR
ncbi:MAG: signal recognition particle protein [Fimbriimonas ginsengisoli]|uniref:Signal recognition particle protein n=1 Tax=Fimbriimonas ginsengisoli TaxID=1005039 RepID=A0A931LSV8_FIMGI|nr:signal recognition particle protein [Fimbriimonas ginsengisoli]